jgi:hypothetical protein
MARTGRATPLELWRELFAATAYLPKLRFEASVISEGPNERATIGIGVPTPE